METFLFKERFTFVPTNLQSSAFHIILGTMTTTFSLRLQRHPTREHTLTHNRTILPSCGTPLLFLSSCLSCEYWFMVKWSNPLEVKKAWHGVIAKWQTFDGSEKNEITSLTSWEITISLFHTHSRRPSFPTRPLCPPHHTWTQRKSHKEINRKYWSKIWIRTQTPPDSTSEPCSVPEKWMPGH